MRYLIVPAISRTTGPPPLRGTRADLPAGVAWAGNTISGNRYLVAVPDDAVIDTAPGRGRSEEPPERLPEIARTHGLDRPETWRVG